MTPTQELIGIGIGVIGAAISIITYLDKKDERRLAKIKRVDDLEGRIKTLEDSKDICEKDREHIDKRFDDFLKDMFKLFQNQKQ